MALKPTATFLSLYLDSMNIKSTDMKYIIILLAISASILLKAQSVEQEVLGCTGGSGGNNDMQIDFTLGEPFVTTVSTAGLIVTQGFHQSEVKLVGIKTSAGYEWEVSCYPNPTSNRLTLEIEGEMLGSIQLRVLDTQGRIVAHELVEKGSKDIHHDIQVAQLAAGPYFLHVMLEGGSGTTIPFQKIH